MLSWIRVLVCHACGKNAAAVAHARISMNVGLTARQLRQLEELYIICTKHPLIEQWTC